MTDTTPFRTEQLRLDTGERFVLTVDAGGIPVWWPNLYCTIALHERGIGFSTMQSCMSAICIFHNVCSRLGVDVTARIESLQLFTAEELAALRDELRADLRDLSRKAANSGNGGTVRNAHWKNRLVAVRDYIVWRANPVIDRISLRDERLPEARQRLKDLPGRLVGKIIAHRNTSKEGMDDDQQQVFLNAITPGPPTNVFSQRNQARTQALRRLYWEGLRRSEGIVLACRNLHLKGSDPYVYVPRAQDDPDDTRAQEPRSKTLAHPVSVSLETARIISDYVITERRTYPGAKKSKYVFISQKGKPISLSAVDAMYRRLRDKVPGLPDDFSTHMVRRTFNDRLGDAAEEIG